MTGGAAGAAATAATNDATVVWIAPAPARGGPRVGELRAIDAWAQARSVRLSPPADAAYPVLASDPRIAGAAAFIDEQLARARDAVTAGDGPGADAATNAAEETVLQHPELPNAAWLLAEVLRTRASRWRRIAPADAMEADRLWKRADALDGGRVAGVGEQAAKEPPLAATLVFDRSPDLELWVDGRAADPGPVATRAGPHAIVVLRNDAPIWAGWVELPPGAVTLPLPARSAPPCSRGDFAAVRVRGRSVDATVEASVDATGVRCDAWVAATASPAANAGADVVRIAPCQGAVCGPLRDFRHVADWASAPGWVAGPAGAAAPSGVAAAGGAAHGGPGHWPAWATWTLAAAGVAVASVITVVAASGSSAPSETRFVSGGLKPTP